MKWEALLVIGLFCMSFSSVCGQPFIASITVLPGCGSQFAYGQAICGQLMVSDDAWVTRWVEDQYGTTWYHWGTRYYTAGTHSFCGYAGLPMGEHIMKIHAVRVSDSAVVDDQCAYDVCCGYSLWIPQRPSCNCEEVTFSAAIDKNTVAPGDDITVTVTVTNNMAGDCSKKFDAGHLEIDWGILGGNTSPLTQDLSVKSGETRMILEEQHIIPPVSEGTYHVMISYSDAECTWMDYATVSVEVPTEGSFEILSYPELIHVGEKGRIKVLVRNKSQKEVSYRLLIHCPSGILCTQSVISSLIPRAGYREIHVPFQADEAGTHTLTLELVSEEESLGKTAVNIRVEKPLSGTLDMVFPPQSTPVHESTAIGLQVINTSQYDIAYQISALSSSSVQMNPVPDVFVPAGQSRELQVFITPQAEGTHDITLHLEAESQLMDSMHISFTTESPQSFLPMFMGGAGIIGAAGIVLLLWLKRRSTHPSD
jgi:hypothetical protein